MGIQGRSIENTAKIAILEFLKDQKEPVGFEAIATYCKEKYGISRGTVKTYLDDLKRSGFAEQSVNGRHPYNVTEKGKEFYERESLKREYNEGIDKANSQEIERLKIQKRYHELLQKIGEMRSKRLPIKAVEDELRKLGWDDKAIQQVLKQTLGYNEIFRKVEEGHGNIILKLLSSRESPKYMDMFSIFRGLASALEGFDFWEILTPFKPVKGYYVIGTFKELIDLYMELRKIERLELKFKFGLNDEDWRKLEPILEQIEKDEKLLGNEFERYGKIEDFLRRYTYSKQPNGILKLKLHYIRKGFTWEYAEKAAKMDFENFQKEKPEFYIIPG